jgi:hypothetical protein
LARSWRTAAVAVCQRYRAGVEADLRHFLADDRAA